MPLQQIRGDVRPKISSGTRDEDGHTSSGYFSLKTDNAKVFFGSAADTAENGMAQAEIA